MGKLGERQTALVVTVAVEGKGICKLCFYSAFLASPFLWPSFFSVFCLQGLTVLRTMANARAVASSLDWSRSNWWYPPRFNLKTKTTKEFGSKQRGNNVRVKPTLRLDWSIRRPLIGPACQPLTQAADQENASEHGYSLLQSDRDSSNGEGREPFAV